MDKQIIEKILEGAEVAPGMDILDISAGELTAGCLERSRKALRKGRFPRWNPSGENTIGFCFAALCRRA